MDNEKFTVDEIIKCWEESEDKILKGEMQKIKSAFFMNLGMHQALKNKEDK